MMRGWALAAMEPATPRPMGTCTCPVTSSSGPLAA